MPRTEYEPEREPRLPTHHTMLRAYDRAWRAWEADPGPGTYAVLQTGIEILYRQLGKPGKFELGMVVMTPGAGEALLAAQHAPPEFLLRHKHGDWGERCADDRRENERTLRAGSRLLSLYRNLLDARLWVITEWDLSAIRLQLPAEY